MITKTYIQKNFTTVLLLVIIAILFFVTKPFGCGKKQPDTVVTRTDTLRETIVQPIQYVPKYQPQQSSSQPVINIPPQYVPSKDNDVLLKQYIEVTNKYLALNTYKDSVVLKDSAGNRVGVVNLEDGVSENQIKFRKPNYQLSFPKTTITNTTTITKHEKQRFQLLVGGGVSGNTTALVNGAFVGVGFKNVRGQVYILNGGLQSNNGLQNNFSVSTYLPIKLRKK